MALPSSAHVMVQFLGSSQCYWGCAGRHSKPSSCGAYGCAIQEELDYLFNLNRVPPHARSDEDSSNGERREQWIVATTSKTILILRIVMSLPLELQIFSLSFAPNRWTGLLMVYAVCYTEMMENSRKSEQNKTNMQTEGVSHSINLYFFSLQEEDMEPRGNHYRVSVSHLTCL